MIIGICGLGFVGGAIYSFMNNDGNKDIINNVVVYDKYKQINDLNELLNANIIYICIPTPYDDINKSYNMDEIDNTLCLLDDLNYRGIILIKSTVQPNYCEDANNKYTQLIIMHNPEFLSASTAEKDFVEQKHIIIGYTLQSRDSVSIIESFYKLLFPGALISINTSNTAAITKLACNSFYATKVQFFTELFLLCERTSINYNDVKDLMLNNLWINPMHTTVPGRDGQLSFGGACLPKDINALNQYMIQNNTANNVLEAVIIERNHMRE
jgi:UDPglucose 6-dehydrogenase